MTNKKNVNLNVPDELLAELDATMKESNLHAKQKWVMVSAAILLLLEAPRHRRDALLDRVMTDERKGYAALIAEAKKAGCEEIELDIAPSGVKKHPQSAGGGSQDAPVRDMGKSREASRSR